MNKSFEKLLDELEQKSYAELYQMEWPLPTLTAILDYLSNKEPDSLTIGRIMGLIQEIGIAEAEQRAMLKDCMGPEEPDFTDLVPEPEQWVDLDDELTDEDCLSAAKQYMKEHGNLWIKQAVEEYPNLTPDEAYEKIAAEWAELFMIGAPLPEA